jgi:arsenite-transporting ATPase
VLHDLLELAPPGVDELVAMIEIVENLDSAGGASARDLIVIDTAPTGHALRLLEMPALVHDWVKAVMAILLKYQPVVGVGELGAALLRLSQGLARLRALLADPARTRFVVVTRPAALPRAETVRLLTRLEAASISAPLVIVNAVGAGTCARCRSDRSRQQKEMQTLSRAVTGHRRPTPLLIAAPATVPPPAGWRDVQSFFRHWRHVPPAGGG